MKNCDGAGALLPWHGAILFRSEDIYTRQCAQFHPTAYACPEDPSILFPLRIFRILPRMGLNCRLGPRPDHPE